MKPLFSPPSTLALAGANLLLISFGLLTLLMSVIWHGDSSFFYFPALSSWLKLSPQGASALLEPTELYFFYGRFTVIFYAIIAIKTYRIKTNSLVRWVSLGFIFIATLGDILAYWLSQYYGVWLRYIGFWKMELPALLLLIALWFSTAAYTRIKHNTTDLMIWLPLAAFACVSTIQYIPHSLIFVILGSLIYQRPSNCSHLSSHPR